MSKCRQAPPEGVGRTGVSYSTITIPSAYPPAVRGHSSFHMTDMPTIYTAVTLTAPRAFCRPTIASTKEARLTSAIKTENRSVGTRRAASRPRTRRTVNALYERFFAKGGGAGFMWNAPYCLVGSVRQLNLCSPFLIVNSCVQRRSGPPCLEIPETERGRGAPRYYVVHAIRPSEDNMEKSDQRNCGILSTICGMRSVALCSLLGGVRRLLTPLVAVHILQEGVFEFVSCKSFTSN